MLLATATGAQALQALAILRILRKLLGFRDHLAALRAARGRLGLSERLAALRTAGQAYQTSNERRHDHILPDCVYV